MDLRCRCPVGSIGTVSLTIWSGCSRNAPCVYVSHPVIIESWLLLAHLCVGRRTSRWLDSKINPNPGIRAVEHILILFCLSRVLYLPWSPFRYATCQANWILLWCLKLDIGHVCFGASWERLWCMSILDTACDWLWANFGATKWPTFCGCLCWALVCIEMTKLYTNSSFHWHWTQELVRKSPKALWNSHPPASAC